MDIKRQIRRVDEDGQDLNDLLKGQRNRVFFRSVNLDVDQLDSQIKSPLFNIGINLETIAVDEFEEKW